MVSVDALLGVIVIPGLFAVLVWQLVLRTLPRAIAEFQTKESYMTEMSDHSSRGATGRRGETGLRGETGETGPQGPEGPREPLSRLIITLLVAAAIIITIGLQSLLYQRSNTARDKDFIAERVADDQHDTRVQTCTKEWADDMRVSVALARSFTKDLEDALTRRNEALDAIVLLFVEANALPEGQKPGPELVAKFDSALAEFVSAKANLTAVKSTVDQNRVENPFPAIDLQCEEGKKAAEEVK